MRQDLVNWLLMVGGRGGSGEILLAGGFSPLNLLVVSLNMKLKRMDAGTG